MMTRSSRALAAIAAAALALVLAPPGTAAAQEAPGRGLQLDGFGAFTLLGGEVFQWSEKGFGAGGALRHKWPSGVAAGVGGRVSYPDTEVPDGTLQDFTVTEGFAQVDYSPMISGVVRPFVGVRLGYVDVSREVTLPPDAPIFGERPPTMATGQSGSGFTYGAVVGSEFWVSNNVAVRVAGTGARFSVSGFEALVDEAGRDAASEVLGVELGVSVFLGEEVDSDGDGVRDGRDRCPGTPASVVVVDAEGCPIDRDEDGVGDYRDSCPNTPDGVTVDDAGCAQDSDDDGVLDDIDECPDTVRDARVDEEGCATDADGDGVADGVDRCPETAEGTPVGASGCVLDADGDGVPDPSDDCADSREGAEVDEGGCTELQRGLVEGRLVLQGVTFRANTAQLTADGIDAVSRAGRALVSMPRLEVEIGVHTAARGEAARTLSQQRAELVLRYLTDLYPELDDDRFTVRGYGGSQPVARGRGADERNERVELVVTGKREAGGGDGEDGGPEGGGGDDAGRRGVRPR